MTQTCQEARADEGYCCSYTLKDRRNVAGCRTPSKEGNGSNELSCHLPQVLLPEDLNTTACRVRCDPSRTQGSSAEVSPCSVCAASQGSSPRYQDLSRAGSEHYVTLTSHLLATEH